MQGKKEYWPLAHSVWVNGNVLESRAHMAWELIRNFAIVAGKVTGEDKGNRAVLDVMPPGEVVDRAFSVADEFMDRVEARGEIREFTFADAVRAFKAGGALDVARREVEYPHNKDAVRKLLTELGAAEEDVAEAVEHLADEGL